MQIEFVKVGGSITPNPPRNETALNKVKAIVDAANTFGARIVAEFVEPNDSLECLRGIGVGDARGFGVAQPTPMARVFRKT
jgi:EAL domain-containing protein (putative c-di-GMP-specific phosphodiesterase class I)